ncbi:MAG: hypothetical protein KJ623_02560 [Nanoarchaeota archaeon]|nr:hypothetical protein [Nanoarchaeota archaeon]MBU0963308.1 hypothetical protein [Nanoarchaeota archaeon]
MIDFNITYESLYDLLRSEKSQEELQKLDENFFMHVAEYIQTKKQILESQENKDSIFASAEIQKTRKQLENSEKIIKELYERRENKIIQTALFSSRTDSRSDHGNMLKEELELYNIIINNLSEFRNIIIGSILAGKLPVIEKPKLIKTQEEQKITSKLIRFTTAVPKFVGDDLNIYGPYEEHDVANLSEKVADLLIQRERAEKIE